MLFDCRDICAAHPWVRELWLLGVAGSAAGRSPNADLLVVCDGPPRSVAPGERRRFLRELQDRSDRSLNLRLVTAGQLSRWLSLKGRFAVAFRSAVRLCPQEDE